MDASKLFCYCALATVTLLVQVIWGYTVSHPCKFTAHSYTVTQEEIYCTIYSNVILLLE
jgi:hypothetical protein